MDLETKLSALRASDWKCYVCRPHPFALSVRLAHC
jgi:hypothetical protein